MEINDKLSHLSVDQIDELIKRYYNNEKVNDLINEFNIKCLGSELVKLFPPEILEDILCEYCNTPMIRKRVSKTSKPTNKIYCPKCNHIYNDINCNCEKCNNLKREIIIKICPPISKIDINDLSLKHRIYLASLLRGVEFIKTEDKIVLEPLENVKKKIAPTQEMELIIINELQKSGIISIDNTSKIDAFSGNLLDNTYGDKYYAYKVKFTINIEYSIELSNTDVELKYQDEDEIYSLCKEIILNECYEYLENQMKKVKFSFNPGVTTKEVFCDLLDKFSVAQIYAIIYNSINSAVRYYQEGKVYKTQAANLVITRCRTYGERAIANGWEIKPYIRPYDCEQSIISHLFFNRIFPVGDQAFQTVFTDNIIENYILEFSK